MDSSDRTLCAKCPKAFAHVSCFGCQQSLCTKHYNEHRHEINRQMEEVGEFHNRLHQQLVDEKSGSHPIFFQIDKWEKDSIERIRRWADEARYQLHGYFINQKKKCQDSLDRYYEKIRDCRETEDYTEIEVERWRRELQRLKNEFENPSTVQLYHEEETEAMIQPIQLKIFGRNKLESVIDDKSKWKSDGVIVAGGNGQGQALNQLNWPHGFDIDDDGNIFIADHKNHRIVVWKVGATSGEVLIGHHGAGSGINQLKTPTNVMVDRLNDSIIISDFGNQRVMRFSRQNPQQGKILVSNVTPYGLALDDEGALFVFDESRQEVRKYRPDDKQGTVVAGGNGCGNGLNQFGGSYDIFIDHEGSLYVSDYGNHRVMKWRKGAKEGVIVAGGLGEGTSLTYFSHPGGIYIDRTGSVYVLEYKNNRIRRWLKDTRQGNGSFGGVYAGEQAPNLNNPFILRFDSKGNLYISEYYRACIQKFELEKNTQ